MTTRITRVRGAFEQLRRMQGDKLCRDLVDVLEAGYVGALLELEVEAPDEREYSVKVPPRLEVVVK